MNDHVRLATEARAGVFTAQSNKYHTRKSYLSATRRFAEWCDAHGVCDLVDVEPNGEAQRRSALLSTCIQMDRMGHQSAMMRLSVR